jgi:hypothetical protein
MAKATVLRVGRPYLILSRRSKRLKTNSCALEAGDPVIVTAGASDALTHLASGTRRPVRHWIEVFESRLRASARMSNRAQPRPAGPARRD